MAATPTTPRRPRSLLGIFLALALLGFLGLAALVALASLFGAADGAVAGARVAVIPVEGVITASAEASLFGGAAGAGAEQVIERVREVARDDSVKAVILRINSPGGSAAASQEIFETVLAERERTRKPFVASMADLAASGGYYVAAACDRIVANRATATGSIGVVMPGYNVSGLLEWVRIKPEVIKSGRFKDIGSPMRPMTPAERELLQELVDNTYDQFVGDIARGRKARRSDLLRYADGRILTGEQAHRAGLVDELGGFYDAVRVAYELARLPMPEKPNLHHYGRGSLLEQLLAVRAVLPPQADAAWLRTGPPLWLLAPLRGIPLLTGS